MAPAPRRSSRGGAAAAAAIAPKLEESSASLSPTPSTADIGNTSHTGSGLITPATSIGDDASKGANIKRQSDSPDDDTMSEAGFSIIIPSVRPSSGRFAAKKGSSSTKPVKNESDDDDDDVQFTSIKRQPSKTKIKSKLPSDAEVIELSSSSSSRRRSGRTSAPKKSYKDEISDDSDLSDAPLATTADKGKGKARAAASTIADDLANYVVDDSDEEEDTSLAVIKAQSKRSAATSSRLRLDSEAAGEDIEDDTSDVTLATTSRKRRAPQSAADRKLEAAARKEGFGNQDEDDDDEWDDDSDDEEFVDDDASHDAVVAASASASASTSAAGAAFTSAVAASRGVNAEDLQYETVIQRRARLRSERFASRRKKVQRLTPYQKTLQKLDEHHPELVGLWDALKESKGNPKGVATTQPDGLKAKLLPFQLEGVNWLVEQEKGPWSGGVLADEMGMGKTIQMISLFLKNRGKPTLVIAPVVAIMQWRNEIAKYTDGFKVLVWHGATREADAKKLATYDVVLTSYSVMEASFRKQEIGFKRKKEVVKEKSALHAVPWHRVVLDEAHNIKDRATNTAKAAFELKSTYRWCLSGTPLMNRVGELYSMIRFLNGDPYGYYYCKQCPCKSLHWQFSDRRSCDKCGHTPMHHVCFWNISILRPIQREGTTNGDGGEAFRRLRILLDRMMLRRTKLERADDMGLPPRTVVVRRDFFTEEEEDLYDSLYKEGARKFSTFVTQGTILNNYSNIFTLLTRMRQLACHPDLVLRSKTGIAKKLLGDAADDTINLCRICAEEATEPIVSKCKHVFCRECVREYVDTAATDCPDCPYCHARLSINLDQEAIEEAQPNETRQGILGRLDVANWRSSTKIEALVEELNKVRRDDSTIKSIVFSQFTSFLDLIAFRLQRAGFVVARLEGGMTPEARDRTVRYFSDNPSVTVFLVSLKAGGVALNLTEASRVFVMDPWWNSGSISQAADRIHRLGQTRPIVITNIIIENSIEARVMELAQKKANLVNATLGNDDDALGKLKVSDLMFLFSM